MLYGRNLSREFNASLRYMYFKKHSQYPSKRYDKNKLLKIFNRPLYNVLKDNMDSNNFKSSLPCAVNRVNVKNKETFYLDFTRTNIFKNSPIYRMCDLLNQYILIVLRKINLSLFINTKLGIA